LESEFSFFAFILGDVCTRDNCFWRALDRQFIFVGASPYVTTQGDVLIEW
jgi:hypothetical protein